MRTFLLCISGPSGVGKGTICRELLGSDPTLSFSVSCTTRAPRKGERHGIEYFFTTREEFEAGIARGDFIEYDRHFGNYYGTPKKYVAGELAAGKCVILEIDVVGTAQVKKSMGNSVVTVFVAPPSEEALRARLLGRGTEDAATADDRLKRLEYELSMAKEYDYIVVNDSLPRAVEEIRGIIEREKTRSV